MLVQMPILTALVLVLFRLHLGPFVKRVIIELTARCFREQPCLFSLEQGLLILHLVSVVVRLLLLPVWQRHLHGEYKSGPFVLSIGLYVYFAPAILNNSLADHEAEPDTLLVHATSPFTFSKRAKQLLFF